MTRQQLISEVSSRIGDPNAVAFTDRIWGYFMESLYEVYPSLSKMEQINLTGKASGYATTNTSGIAKPSPSSQGKWNSIVSVKVYGVPAKEVAEQEYAMMLQNSMYSPAEGEAYYYFDGSQLVILTGSITTQIFYEVEYLMDIYTMLGSISSATEIPVPNQTIFKVVPQTVAKIKQEVGLLT